jgi:Ser/Thr protein kinase RdoA (MazF antagonist)
VFRDGRAVALIDFDLAGPGSAIWDFAAAARYWAPLQDERDITDSRRGGRAGHPGPVLVPAVSA